MRSTHGGRFTRLVWALSIACISVTVLGACGTGSSGHGKQSRPALITVASAEGVGTIDPMKAQLTWEQTLLPLMYSSLTRYTESSLDPQPDLAESWVASADLRTYTFKLRTHVKFTNGDPLTAATVEKVFTSLLHPGKSGSVPTDLSNVADVTAQDATTLQIKLKRPSVSLPESLTSTYIVDPTTLNDKPGPAGSGPYKVTSFVPGDHVNLQPNPAYYGGAPANPMQVVNTHDQTAGETGLRSGTIDALWQPSFTDLSTLTKSGTYYLAPAETPSSAYTIAMDTRVPPFNKLDARLALAYAIDRNTIWETVYKKTGEVSTSGQPVPPGNPYSGSGFPEYTYDLNRAKALFAKAGVSQGSTMEFWGYSESNEVRLIAQLLKNSLAQIGITLNIKIVDSPTWVARICSPGKTWGNTIIYNGVPGPQPTGLQTWWVAPSTLCNFHWHNSAFTSAVTEADSTTDAARRKALYGQAERIFADQQPVNVFMYSFSQTIVRATVKHVWTDPAGYVHFENARTSG